LRCTDAYGAPHAFVIRVAIESVLSPLFQGYLPSRRERDSSEDCPAYAILKTTMGLRCLAGK